MKKRYLLQGVVGWASKANGSVVTIERYEPFIDAPKIAQVKILKALPGVDYLEGVSIDVYTSQLQELPSS